MSHERAKIGDRVACNSPMIRCSQFDLHARNRRSSTWGNAWPNGVVLGYKDEKFYYILGPEDIIYEFEIEDCWYLERVDLNYDELLTHSNELVRTLTKEIVKRPT